VERVCHLCELPQLTLLRDFPLESFFQSFKSQLQFPVIANQALQFDTCGVNVTERQSAAGHTYLVGGQQAFPELKCS